MSAEDLQQNIIATLEEGPAAAHAIAERLPGRPPGRRVQQMLWILNGRGMVVLTPDSRWRLVERRA